MLAPDADELPDGLRRHLQRHRCGSATTTSSTCRVGPGFDRRWREAWDAYRALNRTFADAVAAERRRGGRRPGAGLPPRRSPARCWPRPGPTCARSTSATPPSPTPTCCGPCPSYAAGELLAGMAGFGACGFHTARWEAAFRASLRRLRAGHLRRHRPAAHHLRRPPRARPGGHHRTRPPRRPASRPARTSTPGRRPEADRPGGPGGALQEHPARLLGLRGAARDPAPVAGAGGVAWPWPTPRARGWPSTWPTGTEVGAHRRADQRDLGDPGLDPDPPRRGRRPGPLGGRPAPLRRAAGEPGARRAEPGGQGGPAAQRERRRGRAVPRGRGLGGAGRRRRRGQPLRRHRHRPRPRPGAGHGGRRAGRPLGRPCAASSSGARPPTGWATKWLRPRPWVAPATEPGRPGTLRARPGPRAARGRRRGPRPPCRPPATTSGGLSASATATRARRPRPRASSPEGGEGGEVAQVVAEERPPRPGRARAGHHGPLVDRRSAAAARGPSGRAGRPAPSVGQRPRARSRAQPSAARVPAPVQGHGQALGLHLAPRPAPRPGPAGDRATTGRQRAGLGGLGAPGRRPSTPPCRRGRPAEARDRGPGRRGGRRPAGPRPRPPRRSGRPGGPAPPAAPARGRACRGRRRWAARVPSKSVNRPAVGAGRAPASGLERPGAAAATGLRWSSVVAVT